jgi:hypothetical protein
MAVQAPPRRPQAVPPFLRRALHHGRMVENTCVRGSLESRYSAHDPRRFGGTDPFALAADARQPRWLSSRRQRVAMRRARLPTSALSTSFS